MGREHADLIAHAWALAQRGERMETAVEMMHARRHRAASAAPASTT